MKILNGIRNVHHIDSFKIHVTFSIWRKLVLRRSCQTAEWDAGESWSAVRLSCLSDYPTCQTIGSNCPSGLGLFGAGHLSRERLMQGQLTGGSGAAKFGWTIKLKACSRRVYTAPPSAVRGSCCFWSWKPVNICKWFLLSQCILSDFLGKLRVFCCILVW